jgi:hypothetical protein
MVIIRTSAVEVSIQAVSPLSSFAPAAPGAGVWAIADKLQAEANAAAQNRRRTTRQATLIFDLPETPWRRCGAGLAVRPRQLSAILARLGNSPPGHATPGSGTPLPGAQTPHQSDAADLLATYSPSMPIA